MEFVLDLVLSDDSVENSKSDHWRGTGGLGHSVLDEDCTTSDGLGADLRSSNWIRVNVSAVCAGFVGNDGCNVQTDGFRSIIGVAGL